MVYRTRPYVPYLFPIPNPFKRYEIRNDVLYTYFTPIFFRFFSMDAGSQSLSGADAVPYSSIFSHIFDAGNVRISTGNTKFDVKRIMGRSSFMTAVTGNLLSKEMDDSRFIDIDDPNRRKIQRDNEIIARTKASRRAGF